MDEWLTVERAAERLGVSVRQAHRYADRVETKRIGRRVLFRRVGIEQIAAEMGERPPPPPRVEMVPAGEMLQRIREQEADLMRLSHEIGRLNGVLESQQYRLEDADATRQKLEETRLKLEAAQQELTVARIELEHLRRPWWQRLLRQ